jgi:hypothetical protein
MDGAGLAQASVYVQANAVPRSVACGAAFAYRFAGPCGSGPIIGSKRSHNRLRTDTKVL